MTVESMNVFCLATVARPSRAGYVALTDGAQAG
jgi:hypothetical protein